MELEVTLINLSVESPVALKIDPAVPTAALIQERRINYIIERLTASPYVLLTMFTIPSRD